MTAEAALACVLNERAATLTRQIAGSCVSSVFVSCFHGTERRNFHPFYACSR
jgi:hypothetical protein